MKIPCVVVKRAVFERNPWVVINILKAFGQANDIADAERREHVAYHLETGLVPSIATPWRRGSSNTDLKPIERRSKWQRNIPTSKA